MDRRVFYQEKYNYYKKVNLWTVIAVGLSSSAYYLSDCYILGRLVSDTLLPRFAILLPLLLFVFTYSHTDDYRIVLGISYFVGHCVMWNTIWACTYLSDLSFACVGFCIVLVAFLPCGIASPVHYSVIGIGLLFVDISIAHRFLDYPDYEMMHLLGVPLAMGIVIFELAIEKTFRDQLLLRMKLEESLRRDLLTGAFNRNAITDCLEEGNRLLIEGHQDIAMLMFDLDRFKQINDTFGHVVGDEILVKVSEVVGACLKGDEMLIRWGGEEFVAILFGENGDYLERAEGIRKAVEDQELSVGRVTISAGLSGYDGGNYLSTIKKIDAAMYVAKNTGRNRIVMVQ